MENINWLKSVGKVLVIKFYGTTDDEVYEQTIAVKIKTVNVSDVFTRLFFDPVKVMGDDLVEEEIESISISNIKKTVTIYLDGYSIRGEVLDIY